MTAISILALFSPLVWEQGFIAGAKSERNKVLDEAIAIFSNDHNPMTFHRIVTILESLKLK